MATKATKTTVKKDEAGCSTSHCCWFRGFIIPTGVLFVLISVFNYLFHGNLMTPHYEATANLWRTKEAMEALGHICIIRTLLIAATVSLLYCSFSKHSGSCGGCPGGGAKFGLLIGFLLGIWDFGAYIWMPVPMNLALAWLFGNVVLGLLMGLTLSCLFRNFCKSE